MSTAPDALELKFPSVKIGYEVSMSTYEWTAKRFDAQDAKIQTALAAIVTVSFAIPVAFKTLDLKMDHSWLYFAMFWFAIAIGLGTYSRLHGALRTVSPEAIFDGWLRMSEWEFKKNAIYFAGKNFAKNAKTLEQRHWIFCGSILCLFLEMVCLVWSVL